MLLKKSNTGISLQIVELFKIVGILLIMLINSSCDLNPSNPDISDSNILIVNEPEKKTPTNDRLVLSESTKTTQAELSSVYPILLPTSYEFSGSIWIMDIDRSEDILRNILVFDLPHSTYELIQTPEFCVGLIPGKPIALCQDTSGLETFFMNLQTNQITNVPSVTQKTEDIYLDGNNSVTITSSQNTFSYEFYNFHDREYTNFSQKREDVSSLPSLSSSGKFVAFTQFFGPWDYRIMFYDPVLGTNKQISETNQQTTGYYSWSPSDEILLYGATNYTSEIVGFSNQYFLYFLKNGERRLIMEAPNGDDFLDSIISRSASIWSPNGDYISMALSTNQLCIFAIYNDYEHCYQISTTSVSWSPDGKYLAFYSKGDLESNPPMLGILDVVNGEVYTILESWDFGNTPQIIWVDD